MSTLSNGCCSAISGAQLQDYINCVCAGDAVLSGLSAFVDASAVVKTCGCADSSGGTGQGSQVQLARSDLPPENTSTTTPPPSPASDTGGATAVPPPNGTDDKSTANPIASEILASQGP
jgi:hypothetical protein